MTSTTFSPAIEIIVAPDGTSRVETRGIQGPACRAASRFVEQALGQTQGEQLKAEFYAASATQQQLTEGH